MKISHLLPAVGLAGVLALTACGTAQTPAAGDANPATGVAADHSAGSDGAPPSTQRADASPESARTVGLRINGGARSITVTTGDTELVDVSAQQGGTPLLRDQGEQLEVIAKGGDVRVVLAREVRWDLVLQAGGETATVDLSDGRLGALDVRAGHRELDLRLPTPDDTVTVDQGAGGKAISVELPTGIGAEVSFGGGAGSATIDGETTSHVRHGTTLTTSGFDTAAPHYVIDHRGGMDTFTLTHTPAS